MIIQKKAFLRGSLDAFVAPFVLPVPPRTHTLLFKESDIQDDAVNLCNDWLKVGLYMRGAVDDNTQTSKNLSHHAFG